MATCFGAARSAEGVTEMHRQTQTSGFTQQSIALGSGDRKSKDLQTFDLGLDEHPMEMRVTIGHRIDMTLNMPLESFLSDTLRL